MAELRHYNLEAEHIERPKVLLIGNGLTKKGGISWDEAIEKIGGSDEDYSKYKNENNRFAVPYSHLAMVTAPSKDEDRRDKYIEEFKKINPDTHLLDELLKLHFDAILTTNYTYEIENILSPSWSVLSDASKRRKVLDLRNYSYKDIYLLQHCNLPDRSGPQVWHIHGELSRKSSIVLALDEYERHIASIIGYLRKGRNRYVMESLNFAFRSWVDYLLMADVYCLGFGFDFSEHDLWWILGRRIRENAKCGQFVFYEPWSSSDKYKHAVLKKMIDDVITLDFDKDSLNGFKEDERKEKEAEFFNSFYIAAINDIKRKIEGNNQSC